MYQNKCVLLVVLYLSSAYFGLSAEHNGFEGHDHESRPLVDKAVDENTIALLPGEAVIIVHGIVCSFCSQGVRRNLSKLPFINKSRYKKGVKVEIESQIVTIAIKPESGFDLQKVFKSILKGGYEPIEAYVSDLTGAVTVHEVN